VIASLLARLTPATWLRIPRPTARLRLTLLYGAMFLLSGAAVVAVTYVLAAHATAITLPGGKTGSAPGTVRDATGATRAQSAAGNHVVHLTPAQGARLQAQITHLHDLAMQRLLIRSALTLAVMAVISIALG
jgi:hypothetical protein